MVALEMAMRAFDGAVLVGDALVVARRRHAVMGAQTVVASGHILARVRGEIAERGGEAVAAVFERRPAERPQGVLQSFRQSDEAFAAEHDMGVFEAGIDEAEVIEPVIEGHAADGDGEVAHVGKVGQAHAPGLMRLAENHLAFGAMQGAPGANAPLQRPADAMPEFGMAPDHLLEDRDWPQARRRRQHRHDLLLENGAERIGAPPLARLCLCRWQAGILFDAIGRGGAERRLGRRDGDRLGLTELHEKPHLVVGYVAAGHKAIPPMRKNPRLPDRPRSPEGFRKNASPWGCASGRATPSLRHSPTAILTLIDALFSS